MITFWAKIKSLLHRKVCHKHLHCNLHSVYLFICCSCWLMVITDVCSYFFLLSSISMRQWAREITSSSEIIWNRLTAKDAEMQIRVRCHQSPINGLYINSSGDKVDHSNNKFRSLQMRFDLIWRPLNTISQSSWHLLLPLCYLSHQCGILEHINVTVHLR